MGIMATGTSGPWLSVVTPESTNAFLIRMSLSFIVTVAFHSLS